MAVMRDKYVKISLLTIVYLLEPKSTRQCKHIIQSYCSRYGSYINETIMRKPIVIVG